MYIQAVDTCTLALYFSPGVVIKISLYSFKLKLRISHNPLTQSVVVVPSLQFHFLLRVEKEKKRFQDALLTNFNSSTTFLEWTVLCKKNKHTIVKKNIL